MIFRNSFLIDYNSSFAKVCSSCSSHGNRMIVPEHLISGITAAFWTNLSSNDPPFLCDEKNKAQCTSAFSFPYHKYFIFNQLNISKPAALP